MAGVQIKTMPCSNWDGDIKMIGVLSALKHRKAPYQESQGKHRLENNFNRGMHGVLGA